MPDNIEKDTVSMYFVRAAIARLDHSATRRVLTAADIPEDLPSIRNARVTAAAFSSLWLAVSHELDDEFFGLDSRRMKVGSFSLLCLAALHGRNIERAIRRYLKGISLCLDNIRAELAVEDGKAVITVHNTIEDADARLFADETFLVMLHGFICWLGGQRFRLALVEFAHPRPAHANEYVIMYSEHLRFDSPHTVMSFDAKLLASPVVQNDETLKEFLRTAPQSVFLKYKNQDSWVARLRRRLRVGLELNDWPVLDEVAQEFHITPTTLRRRLGAEGASYQGIKDELRRDAAIHLLSHSKSSIADIGNQLGFQEPSAFHRAFKKWTGAQPGEYRSRLKALPVVLMLPP